MNMEISNEKFGIISSSTNAITSSTINANPLTGDFLDIKTSLLCTSPSPADLLKCGSCSTEFLLSDIVVFIQHKAKNCKLINQGDKENFLNCSICSASFQHAYNLLEHVQFLHKIEIFRENCVTNNEPTLLISKHDNTLKANCGKPLRNKPAPQLASNANNILANNTNFNKLNNNSISNNSNSTNNNKTTSKNEIFIDVIPSDPSINFSDINQSYNITVSSLSTTTSMSTSKSANVHSSSNGDLLVLKSPNKHNQTLTTTTSNAPSMSARMRSSSGSVCSTSSPNSFSKLLNNCDMTVSTTEANADEDKKENNVNIGHMNVHHNENSSSSSTSSNSLTSNSTLNSYDSNLHQKEAESMMTENSNIVNQQGVVSNNQNDVKSARSDEKRTNKKSTNGGSSSTKQTAAFYCDICQASFNQKIHLTKHSAKHTGIKPFKCTECNYSTVERSHLKVHVRVHTGEKPFKCTFCEYATAQSSTLKIHKKRHHDNLDRSLDEKPSKSSKIKNLKTLSKQQQCFISYHQQQQLMQQQHSPLQHQTSVNSEDIHNTTIKTEESSQDINNNNNNNMIHEQLNTMLTPECNTEANLMINDNNRVCNNLEMVTSYMDRKNLPPMKRFKNYRHISEDDNQTTNENNVINPIKVEDKLCLNNNNASSEVATSSNNVARTDDEEAENLVINSQKTAQVSPTTNPSDSLANKLLSLANIALLQREKN